MEELNNEARVRNDQELDKCCKTVCIFFGWMFVFSMIIYLVILLIMDPQTIKQNLVVF